MMLPTPTSLPDFQSAARALPAVGSLVTVPFTARGQQYAVVLGYTRGGRMKVHPFNASAGMWNNSVRVIHPSEMGQVFPVAWPRSGLPRPEPIERWPRRASFR